MKNWSFYVKIALGVGLYLALTAANCQQAKPAGQTPPEPVVAPAAGQNNPGQSNSGNATDLPREVGQGAAPDQAKIDSIKAAAARERAKSSGKKPGG